MANNPYVNKVEYGGQTLVDLTGDTVTPGNLIQGTTAHDRSGAQITGTYDPTSIIDDTAGTGDTNKTWSANKLAEETVSSNVYTPTLTNVATGSVLSYWKFGKVVTVNLDITASEANVAKRIVTLPSGYRPKAGIQFVVEALGPVAGDFMYMTINEAGQITYYMNRTARTMKTITFVAG